MDDYISREEVMSVIANMQVEHHYDAANLEDRYVVAHLLEVADRIKELKAADVQSVSQWISIKDRLPETGESVLVYVAINKNLKGFGECKPEIRIGWLDDGDKWALQFSNMDYSEVLYWLPLPELPKDGDENG